MRINEQKILIDDLSRGLYNTHLERKNHRICNVMRVLFLRVDFQEFLVDAEKNAVQTTEIARQGRDGVIKKHKVWTVDFQRAPLLIREYIDKITDSKFFHGKGKEFEDYFYSISASVLEQSYIDTYANQRNKGGFLSNVVLIDDARNYPNITNNIFDEEIFRKIFNDAFYGDIEKIKQKYGAHPMNITTGSCSYDDLPKDSKIEMSRAKICQIIFDDTTEKGELIDYINKNWGTIETSLKSLRPRRKDKRISTSSNLLRDIDIFNKYQEYKKEGYKNPDVKVYSWLMKESEYQIEIEPNTIRKIVSLLKKEIREINMINK